MGFKQKIATWIVPGRAKREKLMAVHLQTAMAVLRRLGEKDPALKKEIFAAGMEEVGRSLARQMREELAMGHNFSDAVDAWKIACRVSEMKVAVRSTGDGVAFEHIGCPLWEASRDGELLCETLCLPMVRAMTDEIMPGARTELTRPATRQHACIKTVLPPEPGAGTGANPPI